MGDWVVTSKDLYLLVKMLGGKVLIGVTNPFPYYQEDDLQEEWESMFKKLKMMGIVDYIHGELKFEDQFIEAMWVLARSNLVAEIVTDHIEQSIFYFSDDRVIECIKEDEMSYKVIQHPAPDYTMKQIIFPRMLMGIEDRSVRLNDPLYIIPNDYQIYCKNRAIDNVNEVRINNNIASDSLLLKHFNRTIQRKIHTNRLMVFYRNGLKWNIEGVHVLSSPTYNWTLRMVNKDGMEWLEAQQASGVNLVREILGVLDRVKGNPLIIKSQKRK
ncbi:hypothetical protein [Bacillus sp. KH172YL63]|uniref:hypothetical protein n=1 Tax=Bacillus sp. KH172YL63 TaxID=2709784 RepID=UPI0013E4B233|nr:hypothetical protein [Bacillus sp. KH172YL63]BCB06054.1 hypothetical protein KH172YL63_41870 [Bacillus sp. KH172YL63]